METDIWGQLALEASSVYLTDGSKRSPFADTVTSQFSNRTKKTNNKQFLCKLIKIQILFLHLFGDFELVQARFCISFIILFTLNLYLHLFSLSLGLSFSDDRQIAR